MNFLRKISLTQWILFAMVAGILVGWLAPGFAKETKFLSDIFIKMIQSCIVPIIFSTLVTGIAGHPHVGKLFAKSMVYFLFATSLALLIGLAAVNITKPGKEINLPTEVNKKISDASEKKVTFAGMIEHIVPKSVFQAAASNEILQIVFWSILFGIAVAQIHGEHKELIIKGLEALASVMFKFIEIIMKLAPLGVGAAIAYTVAESGFDVLKSLAILVLTLYAALIIFVVLVLVPIALYARIPLKAFCKAVGEPALLAFSTASSESALPKAMQAMQTIGVPKRIVSFVMPLGYSFNLDGTTLYLAMASIFCAQAAGLDMPWGEQFAMMAALIIASKGVAAVPRASLVILTGMLSQFNLPLAAAGLILGVDALMDMARTSINLIGNCLASCVIARWEGEFGVKREEPANEKNE